MSPAKAWICWRTMPDSVVVTGGAGFIGSHVVDALVGEGRRVIVIDDLSAGDAERVNEEASLEKVDITDGPTLDRLLDRVSPTTIYHLAAQSSVTVSVTNPLRDCQVNVEGTLHLLEGARRSRAPLVFTSTGGALYGNEAPIPTPETFIPSPLAPYGASKWSAEAYLNTWANSSRLPHAVARLGNVYGPRQNPHGEAGVVAIFSHALWSGDRPRMFGHGKPTRDYIHVADVVEAVLRAAGIRGTFNVATGIETSVQDLYSILAQAAGSSIEPDLLPLREGELERSCMDPSHAQDVLGWRARIPIADGLMQTYPELVQEFEARGRARSRASAS
jgi:UDP-glucose 4-epimerase